MPFEDVISDTTAERTASGSARRVTAAARSNLEGTVDDGAATLSNNCRFSNAYFSGVLGVEQMIGPCGVSSLHPRVSSLLVALSLTVVIVSSTVIVSSVVLSGPAAAATGVTGVAGVDTALSNVGEDASGVSVERSSFDANTSGLDAERSSVDRSQSRVGSETATRAVTTVDANQSVLQVTTYVRRHQTDGLVGVRVEVDVPDSLASVNISVPRRLTVQNTTGLNSTGDRRYHWDGERFGGGQTLTLSGTYRVTEQSPTFDGLDFADTGDWVLLSGPDFGVSWWYYGEPPVYRETLALANGTTGYAGNRIAYLGTAETATATHNGQQFRVVVASTVDFDSEERTRLLDHLGAASERFDVGYADDGVTAFVAGDPLRRGGLELSTSDSAADDFWVNAGNFDQSTRFSEYVHTRQTFTTQLTPRMDWLVEAMDGYYSAALSRDLGLPRTDFREDVVRDATDHASVNLLDPEHDTRADYEKGARVLAALDARIRTRTDGERSFEHVWARLNAHEGNLTYADFRSAVETVAGEPQDDWLTRSLRTDDLPSVPRDESLYTVRDRRIDPDEDGVSMHRETAVGTDPLQPDTDEDGLTDGTELNGTTDLLLADTDGDGLDDGREVELGTNATLVDTDGDGLDDATEVTAATNVTLADTDDDGLDDGREVELGTNATVADTDDDGLDDGREIELRTNATVADTDDDGLTDSREVEIGTDPAAADTDDDGLTDGREIEIGTDPTAADTDDDGLVDGREVELGSDPTAADTDDDGLDDGREVELGTNLTAADTDGDGVGDATEVTAGSDPTDASVTPTPTPTQTPSPTAESSPSETDASTVTTAQPASTATTAQPASARTTTQPTSTGTTTRADSPGFGLPAAVLSLGGLLCTLLATRLWRPVTE
jgi:hypothetical protein